MSEQQEELKQSLPYDDPKKAIFSGPDWEILGKSSGGNNIAGKLLSSTKSSKKVLLIGGVHGNETEGIRFMEEFTREFAINSNNSPFKASIYIVPVMNPDGLLAFKRGNSNGVDLNRNMATKDWSPDYIEEKYFPGKTSNSEPETRILEKLLDDYKPDFIISFHSWKPMININGPARPFAEVMQKKLDMVITEDIGYPTPGSLGTYAGWERNIPTITLEFERGVELDTIYPMSRDAIIETLNSL